MNSSKLQADTRTVINELEVFTIDGGDSVNKSSSNMPHLVAIPAFHGRSFKGRIANLITRLPLRVVRRSTTKYYLHQKQVNFKMEQELENLKLQIQLLRDEIMEKDK